MTYPAVVWFLQLSLRLLSHFKGFIENFYHEFYCQLSSDPDDQSNQSSIYSTKLVPNPQKFLSRSSFRDESREGLRTREK